ncbi:MAG TPA: response regulator transcription factor [Thermoleophilaceae bacterium]|nr:response regulator transcription factor [Thermoleophilaceae bacterium]
MARELSQPKLCPCPKQVASSSHGSSVDLSGETEGRHPISATRVFIVAATPLLRECLAGLLASEGGIAVAGSAATADDAIAAFDRSDCEVALVATSRSDGLSAVAALAARSRAPRVVAVDLLEREETIVACAEAGVSGFVGSAASAHEVATALERVAGGELAWSSDVAASLVRHINGLAGARRADVDESPLTAREVQIVRLIDEGLSNKEIARKLFIEVATVKNHVHHILEKLQVSRRTQAAACLRSQRSDLDEPLD